MIKRAKELVEELSDADITAAIKDLTEPRKKTSVKFDQIDMHQMSLLDAVKDDDIIRQLRELDISNLTPMAALNLLYKFQNEIKNRWNADE